MSGHVSRSFELPDVERVTVGTVGEPGQRTFYLQARQDDQLVTLKLEKQQVAAWPSSSARSCSPTCPRPGPVPDDDALDLEEPVLAEWAVGGLQLAYDSDSRPGRAAGRGDRRRATTSEGEPMRARRGIGPVRRRPGSRLAALARPGRGSWSRPAGRPCPLCGYPLDPEGHSCPRTNGHRPPTLLTRSSPRARSRSRAGCPGAPTAPSSSPSPTTSIDLPAIYKPGRASARSGTSPTASTGGRWRPTSCPRPSAGTGARDRARGDGAARRRIAAALRRRRLRAALLHPARGAGPPPRPCGPWPPSTSSPTTPTARAATACSTPTATCGASTTACASTSEPKLRTVIWDFAGEPLARAGPSTISTGWPSAACPAALAAPAPRRRAPRRSRPHRAAGSRLGHLPDPRGEPPLPLAAGLSDRPGPGRLRAGPAEEHRAGPLSSWPAGPRSAWAAPCGRRRRCRGRRSRRSGASWSLLMAMMFLAPFMPTMCWVAPEIPAAMYTVGLTVLPVWPTW